MVFGPTRAAPGTDGVAARGYSSRGQLRWASATDLVDVSGRVSAKDASWSGDDLVIVGSVTGTDASGAFALLLEGDTGSLKGLDRWSRPGRLPTAEGVDAARSGVVVGGSSPRDRGLTVTGWIRSLIVS